MKEREREREREREKERERERERGKKRNDKTVLWSKRESQNFESEALMNSHTCILRFSPFK